MMLSDMDVSFYTHADLDRIIATQDRAVPSRLLRAAAKGEFCVAVDSHKVDNCIWPSWNPERAIDVMMRMYERRGNRSVEKVLKTSSDGA